MRPLPVGPEIEINFLVLALLASCLHARAICTVSTSERKNRKPKRGKLLSFPYFKTKAELGAQAWPALNQHTIPLSESRQASPPEICNYHL